MKITYFHRNPSSGYSIGKVSRTYISEIEKTEQVENVYMPCAKADPLSVLKNMWYAYKHRNKDGINHITGDVYYLALVLPHRTTVLTLHDVGYFDHRKGIKKLIFKYLWLHYPLRIVKNVICISEATRQKVMTYKLLCSLKKLIVIPNAVDNCFKQVNRDFNVSSPRILCIGTGYQKNLYRTIEALKGLNCHLRLVGVIDADLEEHLHHCQINFSNVHHLSDAEIVNEYIQCDLLSFVSWYEGFGMPVIEAQAVGRPVVTSNISPMKEISGGAAVLVDPYSVADIREGLLSIIQDHKLREDIVKKGLRNIKSYSSVFVAKEYIGLYRSIC